MDEDNPETPPVVVGAIAAGVAPLPFLAVYAILFIAHGTVHPVVPPDVTTTKGGELVAGLVAFAAFCVLVVGLAGFLNRRRRWLFLLGQLATLATAVDFVFDATIGARAVSGLVAAFCAVAVFLGLLPASARFVAGGRQAVPATGRRRAVRPRSGAGL